MSVAATGFFDGLHLGHKQVIGELCALASKLGESSKVITFWPHPRSVLQQEAYNLRLLTSLDEKRQMLLSMGVDSVEVLEFTKSFSMLSTEEFVRDYLVAKYGVKHLVIGYDHKIGHNVKEPQSQMIATCNSCKVEVIRVEEFLLNGAPISSTKIRKALSVGDVEGAAELLGYNYSLKGAVVSGNRLGRTIGFPTANLHLYDPLKVIPARGVYVVGVELGIERYKGICNIGVRPTVGDSNALSIETHILNFEEDIYGLDLKIDFIRRLRDEQRFDSLEQLKQQLQRDKEAVNDFFANFATL